MGFNITITSKGQMTIPKDLRDQLNVKAGDKCYAWVRNGELVMVPRNKPLGELAGILGKPPVDAPLSQEGIDEAIMDAVVERYENALGKSERE
jgi:AbrB family looped-hinge helix DNA binding protein